MDPASHDWIDGILADTIRQAADSINYNLKWILLDGPVDAEWVEDLNTVLDDNRKLCLSSGEIMKLSPYMSVLFEVDNL